MTVGVVGLGLIGGSVVKSARKYTDSIIFGADLDKNTLEKAINEGTLDGALTCGNMKDCDIVMVAIPPFATKSWIEANAEHLTGTTLVDLCGVKRFICDAAKPLAEKYGFCFVGGHPMAGKEVSGYENASAELFKNASMILTPEGVSDEKVAWLREFFLSLGFGRVTISTPEEHDAIISYTSQLAHIASNAYIKSPSAQRQMGFSAGSYKDLTRVAKLDARLWTELFACNRDYVTEELRVLIANLNEYLQALESGDDELLQQLLQKGRDLKLSADGKQ
ncbi:MAG: prephenate dehydrogenase [Oscillospiraceae bacterium]|nr:prephenate dehydrogenase [Oscillospiraceae bacterium]